jgi:N-acetylmuramoyl-L-alanine amidase
LRQIAAPIRTFRWRALRGSGPALTHRTRSGALWAPFLLLLLVPLSTWADNNSRREAAKTQFERAEKGRQALEARPENTRSLKDYSSLVSEYERVYFLTPRAADAPAAIHEVAALYCTMGDLFDSKYYQRSINTYHFLLRDYPASKYREDAPLAIAKIEQDDLHDPVLATHSYEQFLALHPRSSHAAEVRAILAKLAAETAAPEPARRAAPPMPSARGELTARVSSVSSKDRSERAPSQGVSLDKMPPATDTKPGAPEASPDAEDSVPQVSRIRTWNAETYTRVVIDLGAAVKYQASRISGPDRIYFDIEGARLASPMLHKPIEVESGGFLKNVRVAQNQANVVRIVLEVNRVKDYSVFLLPNPYRLIVDVYGSGPTEEAASRNANIPSGFSGSASAADLQTPAKDHATEKPISSISGKTAGRNSAKSAAAASGNMPALQASAAPASAGPSAMPLDGGESEARKTEVTADANLEKTALPASKPAASQIAEARSSEKSSADAQVPEPSLPLPAIRPANTKKLSRSGKSAHDQAEELGPPPVPELTRDGQHSLTRALGLKVSRIVIDAGHGGHDTGTIGPTGLMEKDLCLDVSLRLGKLIQQKLPGAEVVYTRDDDTFIPLERRTEIANESKADMFLSVHANSSQDRSARGVETYYLNFTASSDAMEVATRENALSGHSVHDLQDIVTKIARSEKVEESRDFAGMIQDSLAKRMENFNRGDRSRGVRRAPFVVLIGADMPSVLAEISFLSNPSDEQWLKKPENRQRIADGLYRGIESYLQSTNSLSPNQTRAAAENHSGNVARTGNSQ